MTIRIMWEVTQATNPEPATAALVRAGTVDLGWIGARAWDTLGVRSLQALQAPFLIDSYPLLDAVLRSPMASDMLAGLNRAGYTGLGLYPDQLRHPAGFRKSLASLRELRGARIRVPASRASEALFRALGAVPVHLNGSAFSDAVSAGTVDGVDASAALAAKFGGQFLTGNITLYPKTNTLFAGPGGSPGSPCPSSGCCARRRVAPWRSLGHPGGARRPGGVLCQRPGGHGQPAGPGGDRAGGRAGLRLPRAGPAGEGVHPADPADEAAVPGPGPGCRLLIPGSPIRSA